ncbi:putative D-beta-hydroxybutyrate dehydrogenase, mitochondrial-like [Apostichopus japonicus]|uniref:Putative D-beta-hydroxybutyrate dehydrogenase, mitochondrial-like n=2 Tax=Stichopus japonicus TaxID=307972 RepID=A0A2G8KK30_STIJA|nr:putative D-beta-hydroxybutyrate dehydrogenase, mitochondrial-like [Apostichopus japonicus]
MYGMVLLLIYWATMRWYIRPRRRLSAEGKAVLVTGCDSGFGHGIAIRLDKLGFYVYAGCLFPEGEGSKVLQQQCSKRLQVIKLDVTKQDEVDFVYEMISKNLKVLDIELWGLVNNAGVSVYGLVEWCTMEMYSRVLDVNLMGVIRVTKAFLPLLRQSKGRITNIGSVMCRSTYAAFSCYAISKHGIEAFTQCLRKEVRESGMRVSILEPGNFLQATSLYTHDKVNSIAQELWKEMSEECRKYHNDSFQYIVKIMHDSLNGTSYSNVTPVVDCIEDALLAKDPHLRYLPQEFMYQVLGFLVTHLPEELSAKLWTV